jgi:hypothetical protein
MFRVACVAVPMLVNEGVCALVAPGYCRAAVLLQCELRSDYAAVCLSI